MRMVVINLVINLENDARIQIKEFDQITDLETINGDDLKRSYGTDSEKSLKQQYEVRLARYKGF